MLADRLEDMDASFWAYYDASRASWDLQQLQVRAHACTASFPVEVLCRPSPWHTHACGLLQQSTSAPFKCMSQPRVLRLLCCLTQRGPQPASIQTAVEECSQVGHQVEALEGRLGAAEAEVAPLRATLAIATAATVCPS